MADDVGGVSVSFTAEASQLKGQLDLLEQRLRAFNRAHGQQAVKLTANLQQPGGRYMDDFRRDVAKGVNRVPVVAKVQLQAPTASEVNAFRAALQTQLAAKPLTVRVTPIIEGGGGGGSAGGAGGGTAVALPKGNAKTAQQAQAERRSAEVAVSAPGVVLRPEQRTGSRPVARTTTVPPRNTRVTAEDMKATWTTADLAPFSNTALEQEMRAAKGADKALMQAELDRRRVRTATRSTGGPRGYGDQYAENIRREQRQSMRAANSARLGRPNLSERIPPPTDPANDEARNKQLAEMLGLPYVPGSGGVRSGGPRGFAAGGRGPQQGAGVPHFSQLDPRGSIPQTAAGPAKWAAAGLLSRPARGVYDAYGPSRIGSEIGLEEIRGEGKFAGKAPLNVKELERNLLKVFRTAGEAQISAGSGWYERAGALVDRLAEGTGLSRAQARSSAAVFSTNADWPQNIRNAQDFFGAIRSGAKSLDDVNTYIQSVRGGKNATTGRITEKAWRVSQTPDAQIDPLLARYSKGSTGFDNPKLREFAQGLMGNKSAFTVDRHMARMMAGGRGLTDDSRAHGVFQTAGRNVAGQLGISPADLQAITWVAALGHEIAGADPYGMLSGRGVDPAYADLEDRHRQVRATEKAKARAEKDRLKAAQVAAAPSRASRTDSRAGMAAAYFNPSGGFNAPPGGRLDEFGMPTMAAQVRYGTSQDRELTGQQRGAQQRRWAQNREDARWAQLRGGQRAAGYFLASGGLNVSPGENIDPGTLSPTAGSLLVQGQMAARNAGLVNDYSPQGGAPPSGSATPAQLAARERARNARYVRARSGIAGQAHAAVQQPWGGGTFRPETGAAVTPKTGWATAVGETVSLPLEASRKEMHAAIREATEKNAALLAKGHVLGIFRDEKAMFGDQVGRVDIDAVKIDSSYRDAMRTADAVVASGRQYGGSYNFGTGQGNYPAGLNPNRRVAGRWAAGAVATPEMAASGLVPESQIGAKIGGKSASAAAIQAAAYAPGLPSSEGWDLNDLDTPAFARPRMTHEPWEQNENVPAISRRPAGQEAAVPAPSNRLRSASERAAEGYRRGTLQEQLDTGGGAPQAQARVQQDVVGTPEMSPELIDQYAGPQSKRARDVMAFAGEGKIAIQEARGAGQQRAVGTTVASQLATALGRGADVAKINEMTSILGQMVKVAGDGDDAFKAMEEARDQFGEGSDPFKAAAANAKSYDEQLKRLAGRFEALQPNKYKQMAIGMGSAIGGTIIGLTLFQTAMQGLEKLGPVLQEAGDRASGFETNANRMRESLAGATQQANGFAGVAVATAAATTGMSRATFDAISPILEQDAAIEAGNMNLQARIEFMRAAQGSARRQAGVGGIAGEFPAGLTETSGGLNVFGFQTPIGGTPGTAEQLGRQMSFSSGSRGVDVSAAIDAMGFTPTARREAGDALGTAANSVRENIWRGAQMVLEGPLGAFEGNPLANFAGSMSEQFGAAADAGGPPVGGIKEFEGAAGDGAAILRKDFNANVVRAGDSTARLTKMTDAQIEAQKAQIEALYTSAIPGLDQFARGLADSQTLLTGVADPTQNTDAFIRDVLKGMEQSVRGGLIPTSEMRVEAAMKPLAAQIQMLQWQGSRAREVQIPGQMFLGQLSSGRVDANGNLRRRGSQLLSPELASQYGVDTSGIAAADTALESSAQRGASALQGLMREADGMTKTKGPSSLAAQFDVATKAAAGTAATIRDINRSSQRLQFGLQIKQINEQARVAGQALADARSFISGQASAGPGGGALGVLQHEARGLEIRSAELGFESTALGLGRNQAQINAQRAIAGFAAPGATGEERAARIRYAEYEAEVAQKQQDISVEQFGVDKSRFANSQAQIDVQAQRAVETLNIQLALLNEQAFVTIQMQVNSEESDRLQAVLEEQMATVSSIVEEANGIVNSFASAAAAETAAVGGFMTEHMNTLIKGYGEFLDEINETTRDRTPGGRTPGMRRQRPADGTGTVRDPWLTDLLASGYTGGQGSPDRGPQAAGYLGTVSGATRMTVGEAGPETIAILRNPRSMTMTPPTGGGGGLNVTVMVTGNNISGSEQDTEVFASMIARKVEETMNRRSSLQGLRTV